VFKPDAPDEDDGNTVVSVMAALGSQVYPLDYDWDMDDLDVRLAARERETERGSEPR
jgi:hypothetical protein